MKKLLVVLGVIMSLSFASVWVEVGANGFNPTTPVIGVDLDASSSVFGGVAVVGKENNGYDKDTNKEVKDQSTVLLGYRYKLAKMTNSCSYAEISYGAVSNAVGVDGTSVGVAAANLGVKTPIFGAAELHLKANLFTVTSTTTKDGAKSSNTPYVGLLNTASLAISVPLM